MINISQISAQNNPQINLINIFTLKSVSTREATNTFIKEMVMRKKAAPKLYTVNKDWNPTKKGVDDQTESIDPHVEKNQFLIDGKPFVWTELDHVWVKRCYDLRQNRKPVIEDYIKDGMNSDDESFNW